MKTRGPWKVVSSETIFSNKYLKLECDRVITPSGDSGSYSHVEMPPAVLILPFQNGIVYLIKEFHYAVNTWAIQAIAGSIDESEDHLSAAKRETLEEAGISAGKWSYIGEMNLSGKTISVKEHLYLAEDLSFSPPSPGPDEKILPIRMRLEEAVQQVMTGSINSTETAHLVLRVDRYLSTQS